MRTVFCKILKDVMICCLLVMISSCQFPQYCPGYDMNDYKIISFRNNDTINYYSDNLETKDSLSLIVFDFYNQGEYETTSNYPDFECYYDVFYQTNNIGGISIKEHLFESNKMEVTIGNDEYSFYLGYFTTTQTEICESNYNITYSYVIIDDTKCFCWTLNDLSGNRRFDSFTKMENKGVVEFHDKQTDRVWKLDK